MQKVKDQKGWKKLLHGNLFLKNYKIFYASSDCGACYAFAALALVEYAYSLLKKRLLASEQNVIDCDASSFGCNGKWKQFQRWVLVSFNFLQADG